jgi:hypothetical protein
VVQSQPQANIQVALRKNPLQKRAGGLVPGVGPEQAPVPQKQKQKQKHPQKAIYIYIKLTILVIGIN